MRKMELGRKLAMGGILLATLAPATAVAAQPYLGNNPPTVAGVETSRSVEQPTQVLGAEVTRSQGLAVTGGDVAALAFVGAGMLGAGTVLVRRTRRRDA